jgi:hypothetical protein
MVATYARKIATMLSLKDPEKYASHAFRRTAATVLADNDASVPDLKR